MDEAKQMFLMKAREIVEKYGYDPETCHRKLDGLMEEELISSGYKEAIDFIRKTVRWYA